MNVCIFIGNLTADPELRYSGNGTPIAQFSIAVNEKRGDKEETEYIDFVCWEKLAETVSEYARKGRKVCVQSSFHVERWNDQQDGTRRTKVRFRARNVEFLDKPPQNQQARPPAQPSQQNQQEIDDELKDLPF